MPSVPTQVVFNANRNIATALFAISGIVNLLTLTGALYMLQIYDRVLSSHSVPTLVAISALAIGLYLFQGLLSIVRGQVLVRLATKVDHGLMTLAHDAMLKLPLQGISTTRAIQPVRDVETVRGFISSPAIPAFLDIPWMPLYLAFVYLLHPLLGMVATAGLVILCVLTLITETLTRKTGAKVQDIGSSRLALLETHARNAEVIRAMGLGERASDQFCQINLSYLDHHSRTSDIGATLSGISKVARMILQSAVLGLGAYLTINGEITAGAIIAASIGTSRAFAPIELVISQWSNFINARHSYKRMQTLFETLPITAEPMPLHPPVTSLAVKDLAITAPGSKATIISNVSFDLQAGDALGLIGPSASGKSTLARALTGIWQPARGTIRLDGATLDQWAPHQLGRHIGYLPQDVELFPGTIGDNIARLESNPDSNKIIAAAHAAGVHDLVLHLPNGYETRLGGNAHALSAGQRQRIALARALYADPFLIILDEPNSNLDAHGEDALTKAITDVRGRGGIVIVIAHRPSALAAVNKVGVINDGLLKTIGPRDDILNNVLREPPRTNGYAPQAASDGGR